MITLQSTRCHSIGILNKYSPPILPLNKKLTCVTRSVTRQNNKYTSIMRIGYPCANRTAKLHGNHTFRKINFSRNKLMETTQKNLDHVFKMLKYNVENDFKFFRIGSTFVPFASHELCSELANRDEDPFDWRVHFKEQLKEIGEYVKTHGIRISMHPDHFVLLNSPKIDITEKSIKELQYHADLLNVMELDSTHKFQIHVGGVYGDKESAIQRFIEQYNKLNEDIKQRLVIENDDHLFSLKDCIQISKETGVPILFDTLHHECLNNGEDMIEAFKQAADTWISSKDGIPMIDYSSQDPAGKKGKHAASLDLKHFKRVICKRLMTAQDEEGKYYQFDVMLEIKDKELAAKKSYDAFTHYKERYRKLEAGEVVSEEEESEDEPEMELKEEKPVKVEKKRKSTPKQKKAAKVTSTPKKRKRTEGPDDAYIPPNLAEEKTSVRVTRSKSRRLE